jgi:hypothetical protein
VNFEKNQKKPDEDGFEYDVRKEFKQPKEEWSWDEDEDDDDLDDYFEEDDF